MKEQPVIIFLVIVILYLLWRRRASGIECSCSTPSFNYTPSNPAGSRCVGPLGLMQAETCK